MIGILNSMVRARAVSLFTIVGMTAELILSSRAVNRLISFEVAIWLLALPLSVLMVSLFACAYLNKQNIFFKASVFWSWVFMPFHYSFAVSLEGGQDGFGWLASFFVLALFNALLLVLFAITNKILAKKVRVGAV